MKHENFMQTDHQVTHTLDLVILAHESSDEDGPEEAKASTREQYEIDWVAPGKKWAVCELWPKMRPKGC